MTNEMQKRIEVRMESDEIEFKHGVWPETKEGVKLRDADFAALGFRGGFQAGAKFILELPELKEVFKALEFYKSYSDCSEGCRTRSDSWVLKCTCGFVAKEKEHRQAISKIKSLGIVKEGEK